MTKMKQNWLAGLLLVGSTMQASALSEQRIGYLYDTLGQSMLCEIFASVSQYRNSDEHQRLRGVWMNAGAELGAAMLQGKIPVDDPGYGRRCLVYFDLPVVDEIGEFEGGMRIGIELGKTRSCLLQNAMLNGPLIVDSVEKVEDYGKRLAEVSGGLFDERNCRFINFEE
jgi:hypothetical protein